jgi:hypothetical protein
MAMASPIYGTSEPIYHHSTLVVDDQQIPGNEG